MTTATTSDAASEGPRPVVVVGMVDTSIDGPTDLDVFGEDGESLIDALAQFKGERVKVTIRIWNRE